LVLDEEITLVLYFVFVFLRESTTYGSDFPFISIAGKSSPDITVTDRTPRMIISFFFLDEDIISKLDPPDPFSILVIVFSKEVIENCGAKGFGASSFMSNGQ
jgi:hypothetical protein